MAEMNRSFSGSMPEFYDRFLVPFQFEPFAQDLAERVCHMTAGELLEIAAGTGVVTRALARALPAAVRITASDLNPAMLDHAKSHPGLERVSWQEADVMALPFGDAIFDCVLCQFGVMFFPDKEAGFREVRRVLQPGGQFLFNVWGERKGSTSLLAQEVAGEMLGCDPAILAAPVYIDIPTVSAALASAGFASIGAEDVIKRIRAPSARAAAVAACHGGILRAGIDRLDPGRLDEITDAVAAAFTDRFGEGPVDAPIRAILFSAIKPGGSE
jgi:SAM-dependent methyltransferase